MGFCVYVGCRPFSCQRLFGLRENIPFTTNIAGSPDGAERNPGFARSEIPGFRTAPSGLQGGFDTRFHIVARLRRILLYFGQGKVSAAYMPRVLVKMRVGGERNRSLAKRWLKRREDYLALRHNKIGGLGALAWKILCKLGQFIS